MNRRNEPSRLIDSPEPGYFKVRLVRRGPFVGAQIIHGPHGWKAIINGESQGFPSQDHATADGVLRIWCFGVRIGKAEYDLLMKKPATSPRLPVSIHHEPPPEF